jgi:hypothetical protein
VAFKGDLHFGKKWCGRNCATVKPQRAQSERASPAG